MANYICNICGVENAWPGQPFEREKPGCAGCGSSLRTRALIGALSMELFGIQLGLPDFPSVKSLRGLGASDSSQYANRLAEVFDYRNTFFDRQPRLDLAAPAAEASAYDFVLSSDVFEHVAPPDFLGLRNVCDMLKPNGVLVFSVPYEIEDAAEHFPDLHEYGLAEVGDRTVLVNRTKDGSLQVAENLNFHRNGSGRALEMRVFSEKTLRTALDLAGFSSVKIYSENHEPFGIASAEAWSLPIAARKGPAAFSHDAVRDVMEEWRDLKTTVNEERKQLAGSIWGRIGRKLGFL